MNDDNRGPNMLAGVILIASIIYAIASIIYVLAVV